MEHHFRQLSSLYHAETQLYNTTIQACAQLKSTEWSTVPGPVGTELVSLVQDFNQVRALLQKMSLLSGVPIEPKEQTELLDTCTQVPGVVMAGVPGAGGYDAIFCMVLSNEAKNEVRKVWASWKELSVGPLLSQADSNGVTSVSLDSVPGLVTTLSMTN